MRRWLTIFILASTLLSLQAAAITVGAERPSQYMPLLQDKRVALVVNQTSRVGDVHLVDHLLARKINVVKVLAPEHGFRGEAGAGEAINDARDGKTGLPILSVYGATKKPTSTMLKDVDILIFDIQDVGARFYTYISTLHYVMEAAAEQNIPLLVLDRPNPNGRFVDGPVRESGFQSFVGIDPIPVLHGMTIGELAQMIKGEGWINQAQQLDLRVVPVKDYAKAQAYVLPVPPSPNLPNAEAVRLYPSLCFFEATAVSVGRGTALPFQIIGHDTVPLGDFTFTPESLPGIALHPKLEGKKVRGRDLRNTPIEGLDLALLVKTYHQFKDAGEPFFIHPDFMDKLSGTDKLRKAIEAGESATAIKAGWRTDIQAFIAQRKPYLLYPEQ
ncbi:DUF1343 domain-containing protein [Alteromonas pelagimontana]|uniref:DUF1343 domain-containing protein n=1 Tax=Alteromonas pelagimontana TaxID=1858656 RepID=A0A6M4MD22_9ALTE|nr:DUF1343 domain-containing protein [Alteromonas pelagimontana]QJR80465.1 DUF1343 domain-containing protein [Alteromonas pelagimontana]